MFYLIFYRKDTASICSLASSSPGWGPMWPGVWQCLWKDTASYPPALPLLSPAPSPPRPRWLPLGFPGHGKSGSPACAHSSGWVRLSSGLAAPPVPGPEGSRVWWAGPGLGMGALGRLTQGISLNPHCILGEGLLLTTGSGRRQPGQRRRHPLPRRKADSRRRRTGSLPPRRTVRKEI